MKYTINLKRILLFKLSFLIIFATPMQLIECNSNKKFLKDLGIITLGGVSLLYCYNKIYNNTANSQQIIYDINAIFNNSQKYVEDFNFIQKTKYNKENSRYINHLEERAAIKLIPKLSMIDVSFYLINLKNIIKNIKKNRKILKKTIIGENNELRTKTNKILLFSKRLISQLRLLHSFVTKHENFYNLHKLGLSLSKQYNQDIKFVTYNSKNELKKYINETHSNHLFPYLNYIETLNNDLENLEEKINKLNFNYAHLINNANNLKEKLLKIKEVMTPDNDYLEQKEKYLKESQIKA